MAAPASQAGAVEPALSLAAELLLLTVDPARGGLFPRKRRRFRRALAAAHRLDRGGRTRRKPWDGFVARPRALRELVNTGLIERRARRLHLRDRAPAAVRFHRLRRCFATNDFPKPRDRQLAILLAWSGVLRARLSRHERRIAARRLREFVQNELEDVWQVPLSGEAPRPAWLRAIGKVANEAQQPLLAFALADLISGDFGELSPAGGDTWGGAGGESGGGESGT